MQSPQEIFKPDFDFNSKDLLAEEKLIAAIIVHAIIDAERNIPPQPEDKRYHYRWLDRIETIYDARRWLFSNDCEYYLELLGFSVSLFREYLHENYSWAKATKLKH